MGDRMAELAARPSASTGSRGHRRCVLVPVATTVARVRRRGYNQAALLADRVGRRRGLPVRDALERTSGSASQTRLRPDERAENVRGVFRCARPAWVRGADVILVDGNPLDNLKVLENYDESVDLVMVDGRIYVDNR